MKKPLRYICLPFIICFLLTIPHLNYADPPPPPPPGGHELKGNQGAMGAPINSGLMVFFAFGAGLVTWELIRARKRRRDKVSNSTVI